MILHSTVLENGLKVYVHEVPHIRTVSLGIWVDQGSKDETDATNGLSHLIEHLVFTIPADAAAQHPLVAELQAKGARFNATTTREFTYFYMTLMSQYAELGFRALAATVQGRNVSPAILERERQVVLHEHRMVMTSAGQVTDRFVQSLWGDHYLGRMVIGKEEVIRAITLDQVEQYLQKRYRPDNAGLVIVGALGYQEAVQLAEAHFGGWEPGAERPRPQALRTENNVVLLPAAGDEVSLCLGVNGVSESDPDRHAVELLSVVMGGSDRSRLYQAIRTDRALAYVVTGYANFFQPGGLVAGMVRCHRNDVGEVVRVIAGEFARLKSELVGPAELTHAKEVSRTEVYMQSENSMQVMRLIGRNAMLGKNYSVNAHVRAIQSVQAEDLQAAAGRLFAKRNLAMAVVGNVDEEVLLNAVSDCAL
jgi:predicted Zn-dependent peptidase